MSNLAQNCARLCTWPCFFAQKGQPSMYNGTRFSDKNCLLRCRLNVEDPVCSSGNTRSSGRSRVIWLLQSCFHEIFPKPELFRCVPFLLGFPHGSDLEPPQIEAQGSVLKVGEPPGVALSNFPVRVCFPARSAD